MNQSFYSKEGLDYLYFARPGTAYGSFNQTNSAFGTSTRSGFLEKGTKVIKPIEMIKAKNVKNRPLIQ